MKLTEYRDLIFNSTEKGFHYLLSNDIVYAHKHLEQRSYVQLYKDSNAVVYIEDGKETGVIEDVNDVDGSDWEYYSPDRAVSFGYLSCSENNDKDIWQALRGIGIAHDDIIGDKVTLPSTLFIGSTFNGYDVPRIYVMSIYNQCRINSIRKSYKLAGLPYDTRFNGSDYVYCIGVMSTISKVGNGRRRAMCVHAVNELCRLNNLKYYNMDFKVGVYL